MTGSGPVRKCSCAHVQTEVAQPFPSFFLTLVVIQVPWIPVTEGHVVVVQVPWIPVTEGHPKGVCNRKLATGSEGFSRSSTMGVFSTTSASMALTEVCSAHAQPKVA